MSTTITLSLPGSRVRWIAAGMAAGLLVAAIAAPAFVPRPILGADPGSSTTPEHTITVTGTGQVFISPDVADISLGVTVNRTSAKTAREVAAESMTKIIGALKQLGIADKDIQTSILSLQPTYDYSASSSTPKVTGYQLTNTVSVTVRDLDKLGDAIDNSLAAGATTFNGVNFRVEDEAKAEQQARTDAIAEAKSKAQTLASGAGVSLGGVASISEVSSQVPYPVYYSAGSATAAPTKDAATPVQAGTNQVSVTVQVSFLIK